MLRCPACGGSTEAYYTLRDWEGDAGGTWCAACAVERLAAVQDSPDAGALRVCPVDCARWEWLAAAGTDERRAPPPGVLELDKWARARELVVPHWHDFPRPWSVVAQLYEALGGRWA